jgi:hypothetical protein
MKSRGAQRSAAEVVERQPELEGEVQGAISQFLLRCCMLAANQSRFSQGLMP